MTDSLLMDAIFALDAYNQEPGSAQLNVSGSQLGDATRIDTSALLPANYQSTGFYATAYEWEGQTVISYRGTLTDIIWTEIANGYGVGAGYPLQPQAIDAIQFFQNVAKHEDPALAPGGTLAGQWQSAEISVTGHSLGGGLAGLVGALYGQQGVLFDNMTFNDAAQEAYRDAKSNAYFGTWSDLVYGVGNAPYQPNFSGLTAYATTGELLEFLAGRFVQNPAVNYIDSDAGYFSNPLNLHSQALLTLLIFAQENQFTDWTSIGSALYEAYFNDKLGSAVGFTKGVTGQGQPSSQMLGAIAYSVLDSGGMPFGDTGAQALFADADTLGHIVSNSGFSGVMRGNNVTNALAEILVQHAGDLAASANTDSSAANGIFANNNNVLSINLTSGWTQTFAQSNQGNSTADTKIVGVGDLANAVLANVADNINAHDPLNVWAQNGGASRTTLLNEITTVQVASGSGASLSGANALQASDGNPGGALLIGDDGQGNITGSANGNDLIIGGATVNTGNGNDIIVTSAGSETITFGSGDNQVLAGGLGVSDTYNYTSETGTDLIIGNSQGGDTFTFNGADAAAFTVVWGGSGSDTFDINTTSSDSVANVLLLTMDGVTASNITSLNMSALESYVDTTYGSGLGGPTMVLLDASSSDTLEYNGAVVSSPGATSTSYTQIRTTDLGPDGFYVDVDTGFTNQLTANGLYYYYYLESYNSTPSLALGNLTESGGTTGGLDLINFADGEFGVSPSAGSAPAEVDSDTVTEYLPPNNLTIQTPSGPIPADTGPVWSTNSYGPVSDGPILDPSLFDAPGAPALNINDYLVTGSNSDFRMAVANTDYFVADSNNGDGSGPQSTVSASEFASDQSKLDFQGSGFQVSDTAANISAVIDKLSNDSNVAAITLTDNGTPTLQLSASQVADDTSAFNAITNATYIIDIDDTAANVSANIDALNADDNVSAITLSDGDTSSLTLSVGQALVDTTALGKITNANYTIAISDTAADVSAAIDALKADARVSSITLVDSGTPTLDLSVSQALNDTSALAKISNATYAIEIEDTAANVLGEASNLTADAQIAGITIVDTAANVIANATALAANSEVSSIVVEDTVANITANATALAGNSQIKSVIVVDTVANVLADAGSAQANAIVVSDTAANVSTNLDALNSDTGINAIDLTDGGTPTLTLTVSQALDDTTALGEIQNPSYVVDISDTAANVAAHLDALASDEFLGAVALTDAGTPTLTVSATQFVHNAGVLADISNSNVAIDVSDTAANVSANIDALDSDSKVASIVLTDSGTPTLNLDSVQALGDTAALAKIANPAYSVSLSDTAADISLTIDALNADDKIDSITLVDSGTPTLMLSAAQLLDDTTALGEIANTGYQIEIFDSAANVLSNNAAFAANSHVVSAVVVDSVAAVLAQEATIVADTQVSSVFVSDTAANVSANIDALNADSELGEIALTDSGVPTLTLSVAQALDDGHVISSIVNKNFEIAISDTAANVAANLDALNADGAVGLVSLTDSGTPTLDLTAGQALADSEVLSEITNQNYAIAISDDAADLVEDAAVLTADSNISSVAVIDTASNVSAYFDDLGEITSLSAITVTDSSSTNLVLSTSQALDDTVELGKISGSYSALVVDDVTSVVADETELDDDADVDGIDVTGTAANIVNDAAALAADGKVRLVTVSDTAGNILAAESGLAADRRISSVNVVDDVANIVANSAALDADSDLNSIEVVDTAGDIAAGIVALSQMISDRWIEMTFVDTPTLTLSVAETLDTLQMSGITVDVVDTAANIAANIDELNEISSIESITLTDDGVATLTLTASQVVDDGVALGLIGGDNFQIAVDDAAANVSADIDALNGDTAVASITLTDIGTPTLALTVGQALNDTSALGKITNAGYAIAISDTAANVLANATALQGGSNIASITVVDTLANILSNQAALAADPLVTAATVVDTATNILANSETLSDDSLVTAVGVSDTAADISANIDALNNLTKLSSVQITDYNDLTLTAAQAVNDTNVLNLIENSGLSYFVDVSDSATNILSNLSALTADDQVNSITIVDTAANVLDNLSALQAASYSGSIIVEDTSANILPDLQAFSESSLSIQESVTVPGVEITSVAEGSNVATQAITGVVDYFGSDVDAGQTVTLTDNGAALGTAVLQADGSFTTTVTLPNEGTNAIVASVTDSNGDTGSSDAIVDTLDDVAPSLTFSAAPLSGVTSSQTVSGSVVSVGAATVAGQSVTFTDNGAALGAATVQSDGSFSTSLTLPNQSNSEVVASATDSYGNTDNTYLVGAGSGQISISPQVGAGVANDLDFTGGISDQNLWFLQSGNDLKIDIVGTDTSVTETGWFSDAANPIREISAGGLLLDSQTSQLVQAMATYSANNPGFDPTSSSNSVVPNDTNLQSALAAAWHA